MREEGELKVGSTCIHVSLSAEYQKRFSMLILDKIPLAYWQNKILECISIEITMIRMTSL